MKEAVCLLTYVPGQKPYHSQKILTVSRKGDPTMFGLPGGKVDPGETHIQAIIREVKEELGWELSTWDLTPVFTGMCEDYRVTTYYTDCRWPSKGFVTEPGVFYSILTPDTLCCDEYSPFAEYNQNMFDFLRGEYE